MPSALMEFPVIAEQHHPTTQGLVNRSQICIDPQNADRYGGPYTEDGRYMSPFTSARGGGSQKDERRVHAGRATAALTSPLRHYYYRW